MKIFPAIDIKDKKCVRLIKGDFNSKTEYEVSPIEEKEKGLVPSRNKTLEKRRVYSAASSSSPS